MIIATTPNLSNRLPSVAFYLGLAPLARFWRSRSSNTFVQHHYTQAMASAFFLLILFLAACLYDIGECLFLIYFPDFARQLINEWGFLLAYLDYATWLPIIVVVALWITLLGLAITGSTWPVPWLKRLARRPRVVQLSFVATPPRIPRERSAELRRLSFICRRINYSPPTKILAWAHSLTKSCIRSLNEIWKIGRFGLWKGFPLFSRNSMAIGKTMSRLSIGATKTRGVPSP